MANVIKGAEAARRLEAESSAAREDAARIAAEAEARARDLLEAARAEAAAIIVAARREGWEHGIADAARAMVAVAQARDRWLAEAHRELSRAAVEVARCVVGAAAERSAEVASASAERALAIVRERTCIVLRVHPDDLDGVRAASPRLASIVARARGMSIVPDAAVGRGGAVVETEAGTVDARLEPQLVAVATALEAP